MKKGLEIYRANLGINVGGLAHLSLAVITCGDIFFFFFFTCGDIYNECNYARRDHCAALCGLYQDNNRRSGVSGRKNKRLWYKQINIYKIFHGNYMVFM